MSICMDLFQVHKMFEPEHQTLWSSTVDTGLKWNIAAVTLPPGVYQLVWSTTYGFTIVPEFSLPSEERYTFGIADIVHNDGACLNSTGTSSYLPL